MKNPFTNKIFFLTLTFLSTSLFSCAILKNNPQLPFKERIQPVPKESGFKMEGYWIWGGSMIKDGGTYHLFCSRWPKGNKFPTDYLTKSTILLVTI